MKKLNESIDHDLVCPDCGSLDINTCYDVHYYECSNCGNKFHEDEAVEYCEYWESVDIKTLNKIFNEEVATLDAPTQTKKPDGRSFIHYIKYHAKNNQVDWDNAYKDENDGYKWFLPLKYNFNAEKVAPALKRNLQSGKLDVNAKLLPYTGDVDAPRIVELTFRNKKKEREDNTYTWVKESIETINKQLDKFLEEIDPEIATYEFKIERKDINTYNLLIGEYPPFEITVDENVSLNDAILDFIDCEFIYELDDSENVTSSEVTKVLFDEETGEGSCEVNIFY